MQIVHASCVCVDGAGLLICGASGSGKSALALQLMAFGAQLVADDRTCLTDSQGQLMASAPDTIKGLIEARGMGILPARPGGPTRVCLAVNMDQTETQRLPDPRELTLMGHTVPLFHKVDAPHFAASLFQYLRAVQWAA